MVFPGDVIVDDCRAALENGSAGDDTGDSDAGTGTDTSTSGPKCKSAGPGLCADTPALNHCNCGAGCYRDSADVGSGFSCHVACKTDADCDNFYSFATTCQPFTADGVQAMECR